MFDHWLIQRCSVDAILEPTPSATTRLQPLARGYSDWWFSVASYSRPEMWKKWTGVLFICQCGP